LVRALHKTQEWENPLQPEGKKLARSRSASPPSRLSPRSYPAVSALCLLPRVGACLARDARRMPRRQPPDRRCLPMPRRQPPDWSRIEHHPPLDTARAAHAEHLHLALLTWAPAMKRIHGRQWKEMRIRPERSSLSTDQKDRVCPLTREIK
jgi:hypothetical protein